MHCKYPPYKALGKFPKALYGGTCSARVFHPVMVLVIRPFAADKKITIIGVTYLSISFQDICSLRVRFHGTLFIVVNHPLHNFSEYDEFFLWLIRMETSKRPHAAPLTFYVVSYLGILISKVYEQITFLHLKLMCA